MSVEGSPTDPKRIEGRSEDNRPREFFWDSITLYVVGVILALAALDALTEFIRGSSVACYLNGSTTGDFINGFCSGSLSSSQFFPAFIVVHGILIALPHYLWSNHYGGNFEFFFSQVREMDRIRSEETGEYSKKNLIIVEQLRQAFTTYKQNWMFILYVFKLILQLVITLIGFFTAIFFFTKFDVVFRCPENFNNENPELMNLLWPLDHQVTCVFTSMRLFETIRIADLILLALLIFCFIWSLVWCGSTHPTELGTNHVASFCFESAMSPVHYVPKFPLRFCSHNLKRLFRALFTSIPFCGSGPHIATNLDFLVLRLFRTDSGQGFIFREMQVLHEINQYNDDDQRRAKLHREQQSLIKVEVGDIITAADIQGHHQDLGWRFTKEAESEGLYDTNVTPLQPDNILVLPRSLRGAIVGFSSLSAERKCAVFVTFGSTSLGIPSALTRVFSEVGVVNFNPYFTQKGESDHFYIAKNYCSHITEISFPENILAAEFEASNDFLPGLMNLWEDDDIEAVDFMVIGPIEKSLHRSTVSMALMKMEVNERFTRNSILLTMYPKEVSSKKTGNEFHCYTPPKKYFQPYAQSVRVSAGEQKWPPESGGINEDPPLPMEMDFHLSCGKSEGMFEFQLYKYADPSSQIQEEKL